MELAATPDGSEAVLTSPWKQRNKTENQDTAIKLSNITLNKTNTVPVMIAENPECSVFAYLYE